MIALDWEKAFCGDIPDLDFVLPGFLRGTTGAIVAPGATGKSFLALELALAVNSKNLLGWGPQPGDHYVTYITAEDPMIILQHRALSIGAHLSSEDRQRVRDFTRVISLHGYRPEILNCQAVRNDSWIKWLKSCAEGNRILIIDTIRKFHQADENSSGHMTLLTQILDEIASQTDCNIIFLHHTNKNSTLGGYGQEQGASRGSSALTDNIRWQLNLTTMTQKEADKYGVEPQKRYLYVKLFGPKINYGFVQSGHWLRRSEGGVLVKAEFNSNSTTKVNGNSHLKFLFNESRKK